MSSQTATQSPEVVGDTLREWARTRPDDRFVKCDSEWVTFADLDRRSEELAAGFEALGYGRGDRVAILMLNRLEMIELYFALGKLGVVQVPLNTYLKGEFLRYQLADADVSSLITDHPGLVSARGLFSELSSLRSVVLVDEESRDLGSDIEATTSLHVKHYADVAIAGASAPSVELTADDMISILYTSGTTGMPKGCMLTHGYYARVGRQMAYANEITRDDVMMTALPLFHSAARMMVVSTALQVGAPLNVEPSFSASNFMRRAAEEGATLAYGVGAMSVALLKSPVSEWDKAHKLRLVMLPPTPKDMQEAFNERFGTSVWAESFGQTECVPTSNNPIFRSERRPGTSGLPVDDLELQIFDDDDNPLPTGEVGELMLRPLHKHAMFLGYWRKPEATLEAFKHLWFHTGDKGFFDEDGYFHFVDRKKDAIRRRGENVASAELEAAILLSPQIADVAVVGIPSTSTEEDIEACVVAVDRDDMTPESFFDYLAEHLPYYAIPRTVRFMTELPRNATGRIQKFKLREPDEHSERWDFPALGLTVDRSARR